MRAMLVMLLVAGCTGVAPVGAVSEAVGEQQDGFPNPWERALFMASNRARSDPATVKGPQSTVLPAQPPLVIAHDLERSARFHAVNLENGKAPLMHESPCTLRTDVGTSGCDGSPSCACTTGATCNSCSNCPAGTPPFTRIKYFYTPGGNGEVAAAGYGDPWKVVEDWVFEAAGADGHRQIVDSGGSGVVGFGHAGGTAGACWSTFDVGDFGGAKPTPAKIASAAPKPYAGKAGTFRVYASWSDPAGGAPKDLFAVVDGVCTPLAKELGDPAKNAAYFADLPLANGCHSVYIVGHDAAGTRQSYPTTVAFTINVGGVTCADQVAQPASTCDAGNPGADLGGTDGGGAGGGGSGGGGSGGSGGGGGDGTGGGGSGGTGGGGAGGGGGSGTGGGGADNPGGGSGGISSGCALVPGGTTRDDGGLICLCIAALLLAARLRH